MESGGWTDLPAELYADAKCGHCGRAEPPEGRKAVWLSWQHEFEDAAVVYVATIRIGLIDPFG